MSWRTTSNKTIEVGQAVIAPENMIFETHYSVVKQSQSLLQSILQFVSKTNLEN